MITSKVDEKKLRFWKELYEKKSKFLKPNRISGSDLNTYFQDKYPTQKYDNERFKEVVHLNSKEHFHENVTLETPEEIICLLCRGLEKEGIVEPDFKDIVLKREQMSPTSFVNAFAIPHAFGAFASNSTIAVAQLRNTVRWGNFDVGLVMLFAINEGDERMIKIFFDWVSGIVNRPQELAELTVSCGYEEFIDKLLG